MTSIVMSHFSYCPLVWMFYDRKSYSKINKVHERVLRIIHKDSTSNFEGLLIKRNSVSVQHRNLQLFLIEIYKSINNLNRSFMAEVFAINVVPYNLRGSTNLVLPEARTNLYGIDTVMFVRQKLWQNLPKEIKESQTLEIFKRNIKAIPLHYNCKIIQKLHCNFRFFISIFLLYFLYSWL